MARMTNAQLVNENIDIRAALENAHAVNAALAEKLELLSNRAPVRRTEPATSLRARFCGAYCRKHNVRSVPPGVFETWLANYQAG